MAQFMDVHSGFFGVSGDQFREAHDRDLAIERDEGVHFEKAWMDEDAGKVFCLASRPSREAVMRSPRARGPPDARGLHLDRGGLRCAVDFSPSFLDRGR